MKIIISPAKEMRETDFFPLKETHPIFPQESEELVEYIRGLSSVQCKRLWDCSDKITALNLQRFHEEHPSLSPALFAYNGVQYKALSPETLDIESLKYLQEHLAILSGLYGFVRPMDGIRSYRLEMKSRMETFKYNTLYAFWGEKITQALSSSKEPIINLASKEYSKALPNAHFLDFHFLERKGEKLVEQSSQVKKARGAMVRFMAEEKITDYGDLREFTSLGYVFNDKQSDNTVFSFIKEGQ